MTFPSKWHELAAASRKCAASLRENARGYASWAEAPETLERHRDRYRDFANDQLIKAEMSERAALNYEARAQEWEDAHCVTTEAAA